MLAARTKGGVMPVSFPLSPLRSDSVPRRNNLSPPNATSINRGLTHRSEGKKGSQRNKKDILSLSANLLAVPCTRNSSSPHHSSPPSSFSFFNHRLANVSKEQERKERHANLRRIIVRSTHLHDWTLVHLPQCVPRRCLVAGATNKHVALD